MGKPGDDETELPPGIIEDLLKSVPAGKSFLGKLKAKRKPSPIDRTHIPRPELPSTPTLIPGDQWRSALWAIDTAQAFGTHALHGMTVAFTRIIQAEKFQSVLFDARRAYRPDSSMEHMLWDLATPITDDGRCFYHLLAKRLRRDRIPMEKSAVIAKFWEPWRLAKAFQFLGPKQKWGVWRQTENHRAISWRPWPLIWIYNGNHSSTAAILSGGGQLRCEASYDVQPLLRCVSTDGERWYGENKRDLGQVNSMPMAAIWEIGRRLTQIDDQAEDRRKNRVHRKRKVRRKNS